MAGMAATLQTRCDNQGMDPVDRIIAANSPEHARHLLIIDAPALVEMAVARADRVSVWCDDIRDASSVPSDLLLATLSPNSVAGVDLVWMRLPRALGALGQYAELIAAQAAPEVRLVAGGREKHLNRTMNKTLGHHFSSVAASLGQQKSRALMASGPIPGKRISWPRHKKVSLGGQQIDLWWHGATFAAGRVDDGTRLLADHFAQVADADHYLDLGCGSGLLATLLARAHPDSTVDAVDTSWAAVDATKRTATGTVVKTHWAADLRGFEDQSIDVIVCNPPFHRGAAKDSAPTQSMFAEAARVLGPGGEFWCVFNSHLPWKARLSELIGPTYLIAQDRNYTLTRSLRA